MKNNFYPYSVKVYKQYFNFAAAHFLIFEDKTREPLHGHNYRVEVELLGDELFEDKVFDFLDFKPIVRAQCDKLDHCLLLPKENPHLSFERQDNQLHITVHGKDKFSFPLEDTLLLPLRNTSVERIGTYLCQEIKKDIKEKFPALTFGLIKTSVEETPGQWAEYSEIY